MDPPPSYYELVLFNVDWTLRHEPWPGPKLSPPVRTSWRRWAPPGNMFFHQVFSQEPTNWWVLGSLGRKNQTNGWNMLKPSSLYIFPVAKVQVLRSRHLCVCRGVLPWNENKDQKTWHGPTVPGGQKVLDFRGISNWPNHAWTSSTDVPMTILSEAIHLCRIWLQCQCCQLGTGGYLWTIGRTWCFLFLYLLFLKVDHFFIRNLSGCPIQTGW